MNRWMGLARERTSVLGSMSGTGLRWAQVGVEPFVEVGEVFVASLRPVVHKHQEMVKQEEQLYWG